MKTLISQVPTKIQLLWTGTLRICNSLPETTGVSLSPLHLSTLFPLLLSNEAIVVGIIIFLFQIDRFFTCYIRFVSGRLVKIFLLVSQYSVFTVLAEAVVQRSSVKKGVLRNIAKFTGEKLCQSLFFNKVAGLGLWHRCFPVNFAKFLKTPFLQNTSFDANHHFDLNRPSVVIIYLQKYVKNTQFIITTVSVALLSKDIKKCLQRGLSW